VRPSLGVGARPGEATFLFEGRPVTAFPGDTVASALYRAGVRVFSRSFKYHRPRGLYCLSGDCPNCLVTVDGEPGVRACVTAAAGVRRVVRENGWPSADHDALAVFWYLRRLLPVGFYYKTLLRPAGAWPRAERLVRRVAGVGSAPLDAPRAHREARHHHPDLLVAGGGVAGLAAALASADAGRTVVLADEGTIGEKLPPGPTRELVQHLAGRLLGRERVTILERATAIGVYEGPLVPVNGEDFLHLVHPKRVVVATGAVERHTAFPGGDLPGVWLSRGAARLVGVHGLALGRRVVFAGEAGEALDALREAGIDPRVVVEERAEYERKRCDALVLALGLVPRDSLLRQGAGLPVTGAGDVVAPGCSLDEAEESGRVAALGRGLTSRPVRPGRLRGGFVCLCEDVTVRDLEDAWAEGFRSTELLKRYTTATMGPCQGALCDAHLREFVRERAADEAVSAPTTARPPARAIRLEDAAAGHAPIEQRTVLHERHLELGAEMEWAGTWKRPRTYGDPLAEYWAVRRAVGVMDVGTLGKFLVAGPDVAEFLERLYPCRVADLEEGRLRYALLLNEAGYVIDDGTICPLGHGRWYLTFTTGGADQAEAWLRDWAETWGHEVWIANVTHARGAVNLTGPKAHELLARLSEDPLTNDGFPYLSCRRVRVAGIPCDAFRLGFAGELGYELHHARGDGGRLWDALLETGLDLGLVPHGLDVLRVLRLEKGHILVGQDTDFDSTPAKLGLGWAVRMDKADFVGRQALAQIAALPPRLRLVGLRFEGAEAPPEGAPLTADGRHVGHLTSSRFSPVLECGIALGWLGCVSGELPQRVEAAGREGLVAATPFYDPEGAKLRA
jgi:sarcosine oxidase, subunit alpha